MLRLLEDVVPLAVLATVGAAIARFVLGLNDPVSTARAVVAAGAAFAVVPGIDAVVTLLPGSLDLAVAAGGPLVAARPAPAVLADVDAVVALLVGASSKTAMMPAKPGGSASPILSLIPALS